ncbi:MAG TPA: lipoate--protein ligase family protein [Geobacteraceae bacterium]
MAEAMTSWRLIATTPGDGRLNMAIDEALLFAFDPQHSAPLLRLYGWDPPALSLGRFQDEDQLLDRERCAAAGVPVVQRITGGGIIFHADELTYSLVCSPRHLPCVASVKESFRTLTSFILHFYRGLGLDAAHAADVLPPGPRLGERTAFCFAGKESYDILIAGRKIGGNAQRRLRNTIFQHGSIPLVNRAAEGARFLREASVLGAGETAALADFGITLCRADLATLLASSFTATFGVPLCPSPLTPAEESLAISLAAGVPPQDVAP